MPVNLYPSPFARFHQGPIVIDPSRGPVNPMDPLNLGGRSLPMPIPGSPMQPPMVAPPPPTMGPDFMARGMSPASYGSGVADGRAPGAVLTNGVASESPEQLV